MFRPIFESLPNARRSTMSIAEFGLWLSTEALRRHDSGEYILPLWVLEKHRKCVANAKDAQRMREPGEDREEDVA